MSRRYIRNYYQIEEVSFQPPPVLAGFSAGFFSSRAGAGLDEDAAVTAGAAAAEGGADGAAGASDDGVDGFAGAAAGGAEDAAAGEACGAVAFAIDPSCAAGGKEEALMPDGGEAVAGKDVTEGCEGVGAL